MRNLFNLEFERFMDPLPYSNMIKLEYKHRYDQNMPNILRLCVLGEGVQHRKWHLKMCTKVPT